MKSAAKLEVMDRKTYFTFIALTFHYLITAYQHTMSAFINFTPDFTCEDLGIQGGLGCKYDNTSNKDACQTGYKFLTTGTSIVTEWSLVCDNSFYETLSTSVYFAGVTLGALTLGMLADKLGRRPLVTVCLYAQSVLGIVIALFESSYLAFLILRAMQGFFVQGLQSCTYALVMELVPLRHRTTGGIISEFYWAAGLMLLPLASLYIPNWRQLMLVLSVFPLATSLIYIWFVPESKIWLQSSSNHKNKTIKNNVEKIKSNADRYSDGHSAFKMVDSNAKADVDDQQSVGTDKEELEKEDKPNMEIKTGYIAPEDQAMVDKEKDSNEILQGIEVMDEIIMIGREKYVLEILWFSKNLRKYNIIMVVNWFATMISYYAITFHIPRLSGDRHLNFVLGALVELGAYIVAYFILSRLGRRLPLICYQFLGGIICCTVALIPPTSWAGGTVTTVIALLGKGSIVSSFCILCLYTSELFPTTVRAAALGHCAFWGRIGSLLAPQLTILGTYTFRAMPLLIVGAIGISTAMLVLTLPETLGRPLPNTLHDVDNEQRKAKLTEK